MLCSSLLRILSSHVHIVLVLFRNLHAILEHPLSNLLEVDLAIQLPLVVVEEVLVLAQMIFSDEVLLGHELLRVRHERLVQQILLVQLSPIPVHGRVHEPHLSGTQGGIDAREASWTVVHGDVHAELILEALVEGSRL